MAKSQGVYKSLTYSNEIKAQIVASGGTVVFVKDNIIMASEISEEQYRELLKSPYIDKLDVLPLKRYANEGIKYEQSDINKDAIATQKINTKIASLRK